MSSPPTPAPTSSPTPSSFGQRTLAPSDNRFRPPAAETCPSATVVASTVRQLKTAVRRARPGAVIAVTAGTYRTRLLITARATAAKPIFLCGSGRVIIDGGGTQTGPVIDFRRTRYWRVLNLTVQNGSFGVRGRHTNQVTLQRLIITDIGRRGVWWRDFSSSNVVRESTIVRTGRTDKARGQGVAVGHPASQWCRPSRCVPDENNGNVIMTSTITATTGSAVLAYEATYNGVVDHNMIDGRLMADDDAWVEIRGVSWTVSSNQGRHSPRDGYRSHQTAEGSGAGNIFRRNTGRDLNERGAGGYLVALRPDPSAQLSCNNKVSDHSAPVSNRRCRR
jgi:hypothetical protein